MTWGCWMPHKFKIAVSRLPAQLRRGDDQGLRRGLRRRGYELHVGGNGGIKVRGTDLLCKVATEEEALEHCAAFIQLYREEARYLERTAPWIERVGLDYAQGARSSRTTAGRDALAARFRYSQQLHAGRSLGRARRRRRRATCTATSPTVRPIDGVTQ